MARKTPAQAAANWKAGMSSATAQQNYTTGTQQTSKNPMQLAAAQKDKAAANYNAAVANGPWAQKLMSKPVSAWKSACAQGASRLAAGANKGLAKYQANNQAMQSVYDEMGAAAAASGGDGGDKASAAIKLLIRAKQEGRTKAS